MSSTDLRARWSRRSTARLSRHRRRARRDRANVVCTAQESARDGDPAASHARARWWRSSPSIAGTRGGRRARRHRRAHAGRLDRRAAGRRPGAADAARSGFRSRRRRWSAWSTTTAGSPRSRSAYSNRTASAGSIVGWPPRPTPSSGTTRSLAPLDAVLAVDGPDGVPRGGGAADRLVVRRGRDRRSDAASRSSITPLGDLPTLFPVASARRVVRTSTWEAGELTLSSPAAARALTATRPHDRRLVPRAGAGRGVAGDRRSGRRRHRFGRRRSPPIEDARRSRNARRVRATGCSQRRSTPGRSSFVAIDENRVDDAAARRACAACSARRRIDAVVAHDRAEMLMVFGAIAPGRLGAPLDAPTFRVVSGVRRRRPGRARTQSRPTC